MKKIIFLLIIIATLVFAGQVRPPQESADKQQAEMAEQTEATPAVIADHLEIPWALAFLPDGNILFTERPGRVRLVDKDGAAEPILIAQIPEVKHIGEGGLLGLALHPDFADNGFVYLYYTYAAAGDNTQNRVVRYKLEDNKLTNEKVIIDKIPGAANHNGGRIKFGPDGFLYVTTGDSQNPSLAQDTNSLAGKILRITDTGAPAPTNPFGSLVYSSGHRNPQGLAWEKDGRLWETEHGSTTYDEVNVIYPGLNYGWPEIRGNQEKEGLEKPFLHSGSSTWAPSGAAIKDDVLYFAGLRGSAIFALDIKPDPRLIVGEKRPTREFFKNEFGRIREVVLGPDGFLYIATSNRDGRGLPRAGDDKILRLDPNKQF